MVTVVERIVVLGIFNMSLNAVGYEEIQFDLWQVYRRVVIGNEAKEMCCGEFTGDLTTFF